MASLRLLQPCPAGIPDASCFGVESIDRPRCPEQGVVLRLLVVSADPYLRDGLKRGEPRSVAGYVVARIEESTLADWPTGKTVGMGGRPFDTLQAMTAQELLDAVWFDLSDVPESELTRGVGVLGMPGSTAYGGLEVLQPLAGQTLFVSAAAGAVGSLVGQIAKHVYGCTVIGSCGGPEKCLTLTRLGFDFAVDYKQCSDAAQLAKRLLECCPEGIDMYFENVGGMHFEAAMRVLRTGGRVAVCGAISTYNSEGSVFSDGGFAEAAKLHLGPMIFKQQRIEGFLCRPWLVGKKGQFHQDMRRWLAEGKVKVEETVYDGLDKWPEGFRALFTGDNTGKVAVRC